MKLFGRVAASAAFFLHAYACTGANVPENVILFIGDGMSTPQRMIAEEFSRKTGSGPLAINALPHQATTRTCSANSLVTDSAAAATAIACGVKTYNHGIGVDADGTPAVSCAEVAHRAGRKVGICSTVTITHATPAGFYGHQPQRGQTYALALDLARSGFDFFAGGGLDWTYDKKDDPRYVGNGYDVAVSNGYRIVKTRAEFAALKPGDGKILTRFTDGPLDAAIDVKPDAAAPTLAEITAKAIEMLENEKGFFLMVEGGRIDWAGHANDAAANLRDVLALDEAVKVALAFQEKKPGKTLVVVTGDHETGGMTMGFAGTGYALYVERLAHQDRSIAKFEADVRWRFDNVSNCTFETVQPLMNESFGFVFPGMDTGGNDTMKLTKAEVKTLREAFDHDAALYAKKVGENTAYDGDRKYRLGGACRRVLTEKAGIGWSSGAHTAMPVLTTAAGPGADRFRGFVENTEISKIIKSFYE